MSLLNLVLMVRANQMYDFRIEASAYPTTSFYMALVVGIIALRHLWARSATAIAGARRRRAGSRRPLLLFAAIHTAAILLSTLSPGMPDSRR